MLRGWKYAAVTWLLFSPPSTRHRSRRCCSGGRARRAAGQTPVQLLGSLVTAATTSLTVGRRADRSQRSGAVHDDRANWVLTPHPQGLDLLAGPLVDQRKDRREQRSHVSSAHAVRDHQPTASCQASTRCCTVPLRAVGGGGVTVSHNVHVQGREGRAGVQ